jgi:hypothetical protein
MMTEDIAEVTEHGWGWRHGWDWGVHLYSGWPKVFD